MLLGVSRTSKTPLSMYLAYQGYKVANVPLAQGIDAAQVDLRGRSDAVFGLISTVDVIAEIRDSRLGDDMPAPSPAPMPSPRACAASSRRLVPS